MGQLVQCGRRKPKRQGNFGAENGGRGVDLGDLNENTRSDLVAIIGSDIIAETGYSARPCRTDDEETLPDHLCCAIIIVISIHNGQLFRCLAMEVIDGHNPLVEKWRTTRHDRGCWGDY